MSLFNAILGAMENPEQEGSSDGLGSILNMVGQISGNAQAEPSAIQSAMSILGSFTRSSLQEQRNNGGEGQVQDLINQFAGTQPNNQVVNMLFSNSQVQQIVEQISARTGMDGQTIESLLPSLLPLVLNFLKTGNSNSGGGNSVLSSFLDADGDGDVDLGDALNMASGYLGR